MDYPSPTSHPRNTFCFEIADFECVINFYNNQREDCLRLLPPLAPFLIEHRREPKPLFTLQVDDYIKPCSKEHRKHICTSQASNGDISVDQLNTGGYQFYIRNIQHQECCLLITNKNFSQCRCALSGNTTMRRHGLTNALMLIFAFASCYQDTLLIHASLVRNDGWGYPFIAKSGTGKSTQAGMWLRYIPGSDLMNDDNPIIRIIDKEIIVYGSPWSGKTPCYRRVKTKLKAITHISRAKKNRIERLEPLDAFATILTSCSNMRWDRVISNHIYDTIGKIIEQIPVYTLHCRPDKESAEICYQEVHQDHNHGRDKMP
ncbi:MAG: hypothetical protein PUD23_11420 [Prevotella sp.]|nr:hypothetical protein [Prevotella sp.]